ncbi:MAG: IPT/TIG domain-containing protein [Spirochaetaceae bacterium]|jgi:transglutaminase-like putative cysteine protease|nr:IPT/TIG domain-containing protein [Spirochaetaceae bacterium]
MSRPPGAAPCSALLILFCLCLSCAKEKPVIVSLDPSAGQAGEVLKVRGTGFGHEKGSSYVTIAGIPLTSSSYLGWEDREIRIKIPEFNGAGLVSVHRDRVKSNPLLFSNQAAMPAPVPDTDRSLGPLISAVNPASGPVGSRIVLQGSGFGSSRGASGVFFPWQSEVSPTVPAEEREARTVEVFDGEFGYEHWSDREIWIRVPDGAASGSLEVRTPAQNAGSVFFKVTDSPGTKTFKDKRRYTVSYGVDIKAQAAHAPNTLYLWVPRPVRSASQRLVDPPVSNIAPFVENYQGTALFQLTDVAADAALRMTAIIEVYTVETAVQSPSQKPKPHDPSPVQAVYTLPSALIPADNPNVAALAQRITGAGNAGNEQSPYEKARRIYEWLLREGGIRRASGDTGGALEALQEKRCDAYGAALLFCALARATQIPALPAAGVLVYDSRAAVRHYWAEFWVEGLGWVPLDPALGAGAGPEGFPSREDAASYYFGSLDNRRITFSRGQAALSRMDPRGRTMVRNREYALQDVWEEAVGGLESYSSLWSDITVTGIYTH